MKIILIISCLVLALSSSRADYIDDYLDNMKDIFSSCAKENGIPEGEPRKIFEEDQKAGIDHASCLRSCILEKLDMLKDKRLDLDKINEFIETIFPDDPGRVDQLKKVAADCADQVKTNGIQDDCKAAYFYTECYLKNH